MKKYVSLIMLAVALMFAQQADAQLQFGVKGGLNVSSISFNQDLFDSSNRSGWFLGPTMKLSTPILGLGLDASALYEQKSSQVENTKVQSGETTINQKSVIIPVNVRWGFGLGSMASMFVFAGPQFGFNVGKDEFTWTSREDYQNTFQLKKSNLSVNVGAGVSLLKHLQVTANYSIATGKTGEAKVSKVIDDTYDTITTGKANAWQVSLSYFF
ncbi:porin family protein [Hallella bergensis]|uniref:porin family protein n=1 Tax=Hallella bergensis TaxID=242750 RepID=UPI0023F0AAF2|nr:porin family protein [Hallella bergensis]